MFSECSWNSMDSFAEIENCLDVCAWILLRCSVLALCAFASASVPRLCVRVQFTVTFYPTTWLCFLRHGKDNNAFCYDSRHTIAQPHNHALSPSLSLTHTHTHSLIHSRPYDAHRCSQQSDSLIDDQHHLQCLNNVCRRLHIGRGRAHITVMICCTGHCAL